MARDVLITPASGLVDFLDSSVSKASMALGTDGILTLTGGANPIVFKTSTSGSSILRADGTSGTVFEITDDLSNSLMSVNTIAGLPVLEVFADNHIVAGRYGQNDFYLNTDGSLGLGTSSPSSVLDIYEQSGKDNKLRFHSSTTGSGTSNGSRIGLNGAELLINNIENSAIKIYTQSTQTNGITILGDGKVGIGTTSPSEKLEISIGNVFVNGNNGQGIKLGSTNGIFRQASNELGFNTNNSERMRIDASGNVGIGNPADSGGNGALSSLVTLRIGGTGTIDSDAGQGLLQLRGYSANVNQNVGTIEFVDDRNGTDDIIGRINSSRDTSIGDGNLKFSTATSAGVLSEAMRIDSSGNVGIGTASPTQKLVVNGNNTNALFKSSGTSGVDAGIEIRGGRNGTVDDETSYIHFTNYDDNASPVGVHNLGRIYGSMASAQGRDGTITIEGFDGTSYQHGLTVDENGLVGIGTTSPGSYFGSGNTLVIANTASSAGITIVSNTANSGNIYFSDGTSGSDRTRGLVGYNHAANYMVFHTDAAEAMRINSSGNVGIGTVAPSQKLHVQGNLRVTGAFYDSNNAAGTSGQVLTSTGSATDWKTLDEISGVTASNPTTTNYVTKWSDGTNEVITDSIIQDNGNIGIGVAPANGYKLKVAGNGYFSGTLTEASSLAIKENIENFTPSIDKINKIRPVKYNKKGSDKKEIGLIAEELEELFPELVEKDENGNPSGVNYSRAVTVLLGGFKELYKELQEIKKRI